MLPFMCFFLQKHLCLTSNSAGFEALYWHMAVVQVDHVTALSDDDAPQPVRQGSARAQIAKRRPAKPKCLLKVNIEPDGRSMRQRVQGTCGCLCDCFVPFRTIDIFEKLVKLRKEIAGLEKVEQDNYAQSLLL